MRAQSSTRPSRLAELSNSTNRRHLTTDCPTQVGKGGEVASYRARLQLLQAALHAAVRSAQLAGPDSAAGASAQVLSLNCPMKL